MRFLLVVPLLASLAGATPAPEGECEQFPGHRFKGVDGLSFARSDDFLVGQALSPVTAGSSRRLVAAMLPCGAGFQPATTAFEPAFALHQW